MKFAYKRWNFRDKAAIARCLQRGYTISTVTTVTLDMFFYLVPIKIIIIIIIIIIITIII